MVKIVIEQVGLRTITYVGYLKFIPILHVEKGQAKKIFLTIRLVHATPFNNELCKALFNYGGNIYDLSNGVEVIFNGNFNTCNRIMLTTPAVIYLTGHGEYMFKIECGYYSNGKKIVTDSRTITVTYDYGIPQKTATPTHVKTSPSPSTVARHREIQWKKIALITIPLIGGAVLFYVLKRR